MILNDDNFQLNKNILFFFFFLALLDSVSVHRAMWKHVLQHDVAVVSQ